MANCCSGQTCYNLVTIGNIESMVNAASLDCTNYSSATSISYNGCCGNEGYGSYSPNLSELTSNSGNVRFQNWSGGTHLYQDNDGIVVTDPSWGGSTCCTGTSNVPLNNIDLRYAKFSGFTVSGNITSPACSTGTNGHADFKYSTERHEVDGCSSTDSTISSELSTYSSNIAWGDIISAVSIGNGSWREYSSYTDTKIGYITIPKANIFQPIFDKSIIITNSHRKCDGITVTSSGNSVNVRVMPKFRDCAKSDYIDSYTVTKLSGARGSFRWTHTDTCDREANYITKNGTTLTVGTYEGTIEPKSVTASPSSAATASYGNGSITLTVLKNEKPDMRRITVTVTFDICGASESSYCEFCQEKGIIIIPVGGNCSTGLATLFPTVMCGDSV